MVGATKKLFYVFLVMLCGVNVSAQDVKKGKVYSISKPILRADDGLTVKYVLPPSGADEDYDPDHVDFGIFANHRENFDYGYSAGDPEWLSYLDPAVDYSDLEYDEEKDLGWQDFQKYVGDLKVSFTQPRPKVNTSGSIRTRYEPPKHLSPFGRSYTVSMLGAGRKASGGSIIHDAIENGNNAGHILLFGPVPKAEIATPDTNLPGVVFDVTVTGANKMVKDYGDQCSLNLFHAGRVHMGGAIEGDWLIDRRIIMTGKTNYQLDSKSIIRNRLPFDKAYDSFIGPHLVELWCWGVLVDQKEVQVELPRDIKLSATVETRPSQPKEEKLAIYFAPNLDIGPGLPSQYSQPSILKPIVNQPLGELKPDNNAENNPSEPTEFKPIKTPDFGLIPLELIDIPAREPLPAPGKDLGGKANDVSEDMSDDLGEFGPNNPNLPDTLNLPDVNGLEEKPALYKVAIRIDGLNAEALSGLKDGLVLYAVPPKFTDTEIQDIENYAVHYFFDKESLNQNSKNMVFWMRPGQFNLVLAWKGDIGVRRRIRLAEKVITVVAADNDKSAVITKAVRGQQTPVFNFGDIQINMEGKSSPIYPKTNRTFSLKSKVDFSRYELYYQLRKTGGYLHGCQPYEWLASESGDNHYEAGSQTSMRLIALGRDHTRFREGDLTVASLLRTNGAREVISVNMPAHSGQYELLVFVGQKNAEITEVIDPKNSLVVGKYPFSVTHPKAELSLPDGNTISVEAAEWAIKTQPYLPDGTAPDEYRVRVLGLDGYLKEKRGLDPALSGRRGLRADYFYMSKDDFAPDRFTRLAKGGHSAAYYNNDDAGTIRTPFWKTIKDGSPINIPGKSLYNDTYITNSLGYELARQRVYWKPWNSRSFLSEFYFSNKYPLAILPLEPDKSNWIKPDDRLRKRAVWDPTLKECILPILKVVKNGVPGASDGAIP